MRYQQKLGETVVVGPGLSERHYLVIVDGKPTNITRVYHLVGKPPNFTKNELRFADESFDMSNINAVGWQEWIEARIVPRETSQVNA